MGEGRGAPRVRPPRHLRLAIDQPRRVRDPRPLRDIHHAHPAWLASHHAGDPPPGGGGVGGRDPRGAGPRSHDDRHRVGGQPGVHHRRQGRVARRAARLRADHPQPDDHGTGRLPHGRAATFTWSRVRVPIYLAASGPKTLRLAGQIADGAVIRTGLTPAIVRDSIAQVHAGAREAGATPPSSTCGGGPTSTWGRATPRRWRTSRPRSPWPATT